MFIDERRETADVSGARNAARPPWLASMPSTASELVCVGKIKSNGISQSLFIDRSEWPPKTSQHKGGPGALARPHQTRAAAVVAAAAVAAAAPKVISISPVANPHRSHTVIRRAVNPAHHHHYQQLNKYMMHDDKHKTGRSEVQVIEMVSTAGCIQRTSDAATDVSRQAYKRTFEQMKDSTPRSHHLRVQLRSDTKAQAKTVRIEDANTVVASSTTSTALPGSSVLLPWLASKGGGDGRQQLRPLLPRTVDMSPACDMTNVVTIIPTMSPVPTPCKKFVASSSNESPSSTRVSALIAPAAADSPVSAYTHTTSVACTSTATCTAADTTECLDHSSAEKQSLQVKYKERNEPGVSRSQLLQRVRLIECEMTGDNSSTTAPPFCINIVPLHASASDRPPPQRVGTAAMSPGCTADSASDDNDDDDDDDDDQPPAQMLEALRLVRNPSSRPRRDVIMTSSVPADTSNSTAASTSPPHRLTLVPAVSAAASSAGTRLVTMKLVNRSTQ